MIELRNPALVIRDLRRIVKPKLHEVVWDAGAEENNEWVYASIESDIYKKRLIDWLTSKLVDDGTEMLLFGPGWNQVKSIGWRDILQRPEEFFCGLDFHSVNVEITWILEYTKTGVARFGRWKKKEPNLTVEPTR
jgi:hypothetical protein